MRLSALFLGLGLTSLQITTALALAPQGGGIGESYRQLCQWDCDWYASIVTHGYRTSIPPIAQDKNDSNVAFFPAYPYLARSLYKSLNLNPKTALLIVAQVFCVLFWSVLLTLLRRWRIPPHLSSLLVLTILAHPAAFFLVAGYSESLFLSSLLLFTYFSFKGSASARWPTVLSGVLMSATRIIGVPASGLPPVILFSQALGLRRRPAPPRIILSFSISCAAASGALAFFLYCAICFGDFNLYMETQRIGWKVIPDFAAILKWRSFHYLQAADRAATLASGIAFAGLPLLELCARPWNSARGLKKRVPLYVIAFLIFYVTLSGLKSVGFNSMLRYSLPWTILLGIYIAHFLSTIPSIGKTLDSLLWGILTGYLLGVFWKVEIPFFQEFLQGHWVS